MNDYDLLKPDETLTPINSGLSLIQKRDGLTFGSDAFLLAAYIRRMPGARAADLGSGTGIIPLLALSWGKLASCRAIELQRDFADIIARNASLNGLSERLFPECADVRELQADASLDVVFSNPPYMKPDGKRNLSDYKNLARHELSGGIGDFCRAASRLLRHGGIFYTVFRPDRLCDLLCALREHSLEPKRLTFVCSRVELAPCFVLCEAKKGAAAGMYTTPPLIMYTEGSSYTAELTKIYETGDFDEHYQRP